MNAAIRNIGYHLPPCVVNIGESAGPRSAADLRKMTGVEGRRIAAAHECSSDLGVAAARTVLDEEGLTPRDVDFLLFCTQTPDYCIPASACLMHAQLGLPAHAGALDYNLGCSGYIYGLALAKGLIETGQANRILLVTAETHSKLLGSSPGAHVYGDGAAATLIEASEDSMLDPGMGPFVFGTDGSCAGHILSNARGFRSAEGLPDSSGKIGLHVDGIGVFESSMNVVPQLVKQVLEKAGLAIDDIQAAVFYQAARSSLEVLRRHTGIPKNKFYISMKDCGNVGSANIPIALKRAADEGVLQKHDRVLLAGFGSGLSWAGTMLRWACKTADKFSSNTKIMKSLEEQETYAGTNIGN